MVLGQALAVFQAFSLTKLRNLRKAFPKTEVLGKPLVLKAKLPENFRPDWSPGEKCDIVTGKGSMPN
jgi:hypothetical protein